jgi:hypothetical protein
MEDYSAVGTFLFSFTFRVAMEGRNLRTHGPRLYSSYIHSERRRDRGQTKSDEKSIN